MRPPLFTFDISLVLSKTNVPEKIISIEQSVRTKQYSRVVINKTQKKRERKINENLN